jgi:hypothetical protein
MDSCLPRSLMNSSNPWCQEERPTPVSVTDIRPGSVARMQDWFAATAEALAESET